MLLSRITYEAVAKNPYIRIQQAYSLTILNVDHFLTPSIYQHHSSKYPLPHPL